MQIKNKKGVLVTITVIFLALTLISLTLLFSSTEKKFSNDVAIERVKNLDESLQKSLADIFVLHSGITIDIKSKIVIEEKIPNANAADFKEVISEFESYLENNSEEIDLDIDGITKELRLRILPHNIIYSHKDYGQKIIQITPSSLNYKSYEFWFNTTSGDFSQIVWDKETSGSFPVTIITQDSNKILTSSN